MFDEVQGLTKVAEGLDEFLAADQAMADADEVAGVIAGLERVARQVAAAQADMIAAVQASGVFLADGHFSAKVMARTVANLSGPEAARRSQLGEMLGGLPAVAAGFRAGDVGVCQARRLARMWANRRVKDAMVICDDLFARCAVEMEFPDFELFCTQWQSTVDEDGADHAHQQQWSRRDVRVVQDFNTSWDLRGRLSSLDGAEASEMLSRIVDCERLADIESAQSEHGDNWRLHLPRTTAQLRYDAFMILLRRGAQAAPQTGPADMTTNVVIDQATFERELAKLVGAKPEPIDALAAADPNRFSRTADGVWVHPGEVAARSLTSHVRRVVINSRGVVIDMGRRQRLFTGAARDAAMLQELRCFWTGCWVPATTCQIDHTRSWATHGSTSPDNAAPACGHHNRTKQCGFHTWRTPAGDWNVRRPDGTIVTDHTTHWQAAGSGTISEGEEAA